MRVEKGAVSLPQRMALLAAKAAGELLLLCPRAVLEFKEVQPVEEEEPGEEEAGEEEAGAEGGGAAARRQEADAYRHHEALRGAWDRQMRQAFSGSEDVRRHVKDRLLLVQARHGLRLLPAILSMAMVSRAIVSMGTACYLATVRIAIVSRARGCCSCRRVRSTRPHPWRMRFCTAPPSSSWATSHHQVCHAGLQPRTSRPQAGSQAGLLLTRARLGLGSG